jgi:hypothetical protein
MIGKRERYEIELVVRRRDVLGAPFAENLRIRLRRGVDERYEVVRKAVLHTR